ncbi:BTB/POZ domain [Trypanosoma melophagium]|uniref:BTB/POZ domain n=1 Tax=Trypanosoma melophagium TaxID=715481 RepID=UPI00351A67C9|nr:BTB/POZ domain [Trypanosoma melophagium]
MECVENVEVLSENSARFRYRCPLSTIREMTAERSHYSPKFGIGGHIWRLHLQQRRSAQEDEMFLSLHLQSCTNAAVLAQFKLTLMCYDDLQLSKSHTFRCSFNKSGSAWGMNYFIPLQRLLEPDNEFAYLEESSGMRCVDIEVLLKILESTAFREKSSSRRASLSTPAPVNRHHNESRRGSTQIQQPTHHMNGSTSRSMSAGRRLVLAPTKSPSNPGMQYIGRASLLYPFEHLETLTDMTFDVQGVRIKAHRCVVVARMRPLLPEAMLPLQPGCIVAIAVSAEVFSTFLRYIYTEEYPEQGILPPEALLDLYLLSSACEFYDLCGICLKYVRPLLSYENVLPIVLTRYNAGDEVLNAMYLRALLDNYDYLIQDPKFEEIPGHLFRRLSLILRDKEPVPQVEIPAAKNTLGKQIAWLAESGEYSDMDLVVGPKQLVIKAHRYILASRCVLFSQAMNPRSTVAIPPFTSPEFDFTQRSWQKLLIGIYRHHLEIYRDFSAEDVAIVFKMHTVFGMDGQLRKEADDAFNYQNALRLLIYAVKHHVIELHERAINYVASNFNALISEDPQAWEIIAELPQHAVVALFRTVVENQSRV